jgi:hypothetical protein
MVRTRLARVAKNQTQPRERTMTIDRMTLKALVEKGSDEDLLRDVIGFVANRMMDMEVEGLTGAAWNERSAARMNHRNGYRERAWETRGHGGAGDPEAAEGVLLPDLPGTAAGGGEGAGGRDPGGLRAGRLDALGGRAGEGDGDDGDLQEPGVPPVRGHRRAGQDLPGPSDRGQLAVPVDRRHLREGARVGEDRVRCRDNSGCGEHRRPARGAWRLARRRRSRSGPSSCARSRGAASEASSWSSRTRTRA